MSLEQAMYVYVDAPARVLHDTFNHHDPWYISNLWRCWSDAKKEWGQSFKAAVRCLLAGEQ